MKQTARLRQALSFAAAIAAVWTLNVQAAEPGPGTAITTNRNPNAPSSRGITVPGEKGRAPSSSRRETYPFRGVIAKVDPKSREVTLEGRQNRRVIRLAEEARIEREGRPAKLEDLKSGDAVGGTLRRHPAGHEEAVLVRVGMKTDPERNTPSTSGRGEAAAGVKGGKG